MSAAAALACRRGPDRGLRQHRPGRSSSRCPGIVARRAVPGHLTRHRRRHLGRRGDGRIRRPEDNFWQLFVRPAGSQRWKLATPPGTADNGGLVLAATGRSVITAFRPSQHLTYTPLTSTGDGGQAWTSTGPLDGALANVPDALAGSRRVPRAFSPCLPTAPLRWPLPATRAGRPSQPSAPLPPHRPAGTAGCERLTAAAFTPSGLPLLAGTCSRPGTAGIFADTGGTWNLTGPALPTALLRDPVTVLRLITIANQTVALLTAGTGHAASLFAAWSADNGRHWVLSPALPLGGAAPVSASFSTAGGIAVMTAGGRAGEISSGDSQWHDLPLSPGAPPRWHPAPAERLTL